MKNFDKNDCTFFLNGPFSNWHMCDFKDMYNEYNCVEQYMMYMKAKFFSDMAAAHKIMAAEHPGECKRLGRRVRNFKDSEWDKVKIGFVKQGCKFKFDQNPKLKEALMNTGNTLLVECNPSDPIWSIGMSMNDPYIHEIEDWGENLLGKILTELREEYKSQIL